MQHTVPFRTAASALLVLLLGACATRVTRPPADSAAAHPGTPAATTERADLVLTTEPPLPGDALGPWSPLEPSPATTTTPAPAGHHHHHPSSPSDGGAR